MPRRLVSVISTVAVAGAIAAAGTAATSAGAFTITTCPVMTGPAWKAPVTGKSGNQYVVQVFTTTCAKATKLVPHLVTQKVTRRLGAFYVVPKPPSGESCAGLPDTKNRAYQGHCYPRGSSSTGVPLFIWGPQSG
jgi:hypothetical protein